MERGRLSVTGPIFLFEHYTFECNQVSVFFDVRLAVTKGAHKCMFFAGWEVRMVKNCDLGLENAVAFMSPAKFANIVFPV